MRAPLTLTPDAGRLDIVPAAMVCRTDGCGAGPPPSRATPPSLGALWANIVALGGQATSTNRSGR